MIGDIEECKLDSIACSPHLVNEVWISPHFSFAKEYYETFYKTKVRVIKYIWDPKFIDKLEEKCKKLGETLYHNPNKDFDLCITDSNLTFLKNCIPSISIFENYIYKNDTDKKLHVFCTDSLVKSKHFSSWAQSLLSFQEEKLIFHGREDYDLIFGPNNYGLICHQILCGLNYSYLEALYFTRVTASRPQATTRGSHPTRVNSSSKVHSSHAPEKRTARALSTSASSSPSE